MELKCPKCGNHHRQEDVFCSKCGTRLRPDNNDPLPDDTFRTDAWELLEALNLTMVSEHRLARQVLPSDAIESNIIGMIGHEPIHIDEICRGSDLSIDQVSATLALKELKGVVRKVGGMRYVIGRDEQSGYKLEEG